MAKLKLYDELSLKNIGKEILGKWEDKNTAILSIYKEVNKGNFVFFEGPPSSNGMPGIHHVLSRTIKDIFCRYKSLKGYTVLRKSGWDTHGLPVELQVEKELKITKDDIGGKISVKDYNEKCRESVMKYKKEWEEITKKIGYWIDTDNAYITYDNKYIESEWWAFKEIYKKGLIYEGFKIQPYSPAAGTVLSSHELSQPGCYKNVKDLTITAQFKLIGEEDNNTYLLAWTTTPWTLPANTALAIGEKFKYVKIKTKNKYSDKIVNVIIAKDCIDKYFVSKDIQYEILEEYSAEQLVGKKYEQLLDFVKPSDDKKKYFEIIIGDFVTTNEGTGIVHIAPSFGEEDFNAAKKAGVGDISVIENGEKIPIVNHKGQYVDEIKLWAGRYVKEAYECDEKKNKEGYIPLDEEIAIYLKKNNKCFSSEKVEHSYPHCWRTDKPLLFYPAKCFFIKTTTVKDEMIELNKKIKWYPETTGSGRFAKWLETLVDWNISRDRFWGTPIPIWRTEDCKEEKCIGSFKELYEESEKAVKAGLIDEKILENFDSEKFDIHKPFIDKIVLISEKGKPMKRVKEILDVWFDSGSMPFAQWHYPFENKNIFEEHFPADFVAEGVDQTRGWFFTLHALSTILFNTYAYKNVVSNGLVLDKNGNKMSKRLGNSVNPFEIIDKYGADAVRWYIISNTEPWENLKFDTNGIEEVTRKIFLTFFNTYNFYALYYNESEDKIKDIKVDLKEDKMQIFDKWILSKLNTTIKNVNEEMEKYNPTKAARFIENFIIDDLSNWYVRINRKRFSKNDDKKDQAIVFKILYECLYQTTILTSPFVPFFAEWMYHNIKNQNTI